MMLFYDAQEDTSNWGDFKLPQEKDLQKGWWMGIFAPVATKRLEVSRLRGEGWLSSIELFLEVFSVSFDFPMPKKWWCCSSRLGSRRRATVPSCVCDLTLASGRAMRFFQTDRCPDVTSFDEVMVSALFGKNGRTEKGCVKYSFWEETNSCPRKPMKWEWLNGRNPSWLNSSQPAYEWHRRILLNAPTSIKMLKFAMNLTDDGMVGQQVFAGEAHKIGLRNWRSQRRVGMPFWKSASPRILEQISGYRKEEFLVQDGVSRSLREKRLDKREHEIGIPEPRIKTRELGIRISAS